MDDWKAIAGILITALVTWYSTSSANKIKARELARDEQSGFLKTVVEELAKLKTENEDVWTELEKLRDEVRTLRTEKSLLERANAEQARVLTRVALCSLAGCPHAARAAEFGGGA